MIEPARRGVKLDNGTIKERKKQVSRECSPRLWNKQRPKGMLLVTIGEYPHQAPCFVTDETYNEKTLYKSIWRVPSPRELYPPPTDVNIACVLLSLWWLAADASDAVGSISAMMWCSLLSRLFGNKCDMHFPTRVTVHPYNDSLSSFPPQSSWTRIFILLSSREILSLR